MLARLVVVGLVAFLFTVPFTACHPSKGKVAEE